MIIQKDDTILVRMRVLETPGNEYVPCVRFVDPGATMLAIHRNDIERVLPRPIKVGDKVTGNSFGGFATVLGIKDGRAWVEPTDHRNEPYQTIALVAGLKVAS